MTGPRAAVGLDWRWSQPAILSVPATDKRRVANAVALRSDAFTELLARVSVTPRDVAGRLLIADEAVDSLLAAGRPVPAVMLDGEDAARGSADEIAMALADGLANPAWRQGTRRFIRISAGAAGERQLKVLARELSAAGSTAAPDSVVLPKVADARDVRAAATLLASLEDALAVPGASIHLHLLVESPAGLEMVRQLVDAAGSRLAGVLFGALDYAAAAGLPDAGDHSGTTFGWARALLANAAAAAGVPSLDGMTTSFPPRAEAGAAIGDGFLGAVETTYRDTLRAARQGMAGKLVGHPAQLLAALLAYGEIYSVAAQAHWSAIIEAYEDNTEGGAMTRKGQMIDQASVRHARTMIERARAAGYGVVADLARVTPDDTAPSVELLR